MAFRYPPTATRPVVLKESSEGNLLGVTLDKNLDVNLPINNEHHAWKTRCVCRTSKTLISKSSITVVTFSVNAA